MAKPNTEEESNVGRRYKVPIKNRLSEKELKDLDKELEDFRITVNLNFPVKEIATRIDEIAWMKSKGALSEDGSIRISNLKPSIYASNGKLIIPQDVDRILYEQLLEDFEQWKFWRNHKNYGDHARMDHWDQISKNMADEKTVDNDLLDD